MGNTGEQTLQGFSPRTRGHLDQEAGDLTTWRLSGNPEN